MQDLAILPLIFITGIATSVQPCLFPLIPTYFSFLSSTSDSQSSNAKQGLLSGLFLTLGLFTVFLFLALLVKLGQLGFSSFLTSYLVEFNLILSMFNCFRIIHDI